MAKNSKNVKEKVKNIEKTGIRSELKKVSWPKPEELMKSTGTVLFLVIFIALVIFVSDSIFGFGSKKLTDFVVNVKGKTIEATTATENAEVKAEEQTANQNAEVSTEATQETQNAETTEAENQETKQNTENQ